jgi:hypothetical protein
VAEADGNLIVTGSVFSNSLNIARLTAKATQQTTSSFNIVANFAGIDVYSQTWSGGTTVTGGPSWSQTFASAGTSIPVAGLSVGVNVSLSGTASLDFSAGLQGTQVAAGFTPKAAITAAGAASAGFLCIPFTDICVASAGIGIRADVINASIPTSANVSVGPSGAAWGIDSDATISTGGGDASFYVEFLGQSADVWKFATWNPVASVTFPIEHEHSCTAPFLTAFCGNAVCEPTESNATCAADCAPPPPPPPHCATGYRDCGDSVCVKLPAVCP